jgi:hypothetical protein
MTAFVTGNIMAVAAVFEIHSERKDVMSMEPNMSHFGSDPKNKRTFNAILSWSFEISIA